VLSLELVAALPTETVIRMVDKMEPDEAADLLGDIHPEQVQAVLVGLEDPNEVRSLLLHPVKAQGRDDLLPLRGGWLGCDYRG
jgi:Mg/Co/Ni transporter MgtE